MLKKERVKGLFNYLNQHFILGAGWVGNDPKACRMYANWAWFLYEEVWKVKTGIKPKDTLMIVDGHVAKIFCRTGLIPTILYERKRPYIIQASKMREEIEDTVKQFSFAPFHIDNGAFYLFEDGFCLDINPHCKECPVNKICKKYIKWTAYQKK